MSNGSEEAMHSVDQALERLGRARQSLEGINGEAPADWEIHGLLVDGVAHASTALAVWTHHFHGLPDLGEGTG